MVVGEREASGREASTGFAGNSMKLAWVALAAEEDKRWWRWEVSAGNCREANPAFGAGGWRGNGTEAGVWAVAW